MEEAEPPSKEDGQAGGDQEQTPCLSPSGGTGPGEEAELPDRDQTEMGKDTYRLADTSIKFCSLECWRLMEEGVAWNAMAEHQAPSKRSGKPGPCMPLSTVWNSHGIKISNNLGTN